MLYRFHPLAKEQQLMIWETTYYRWGKVQADGYIEGLHQALTEVAQDNARLRQLPESFPQSVKFFRYQRHYVFVTSTPETYNEKIDVLSLLHERMDIPKRLRESLQSLELLIK